MFSLLEPKDRKKTCSKECAYSHTEETKLILSKKRKEYLKENPDKHVWKRSDKFVSVPCENVKTYLRSKNIEFVEEYSPSSERHYSIDVCFPNLKIGIEINGNQHYNSDGTLKDYYQERHDHIVSLGWNLIEVHYSRCFSDDSIEKIFDFSMPISSNEEIERIKSILNTPKRKTRTRAEFFFDRYTPIRAAWE